MNFRPRSRDELELNITPLIDVVFLLLIFFMVSTTFQKESQLKVQLPKASTEPLKQEELRRIEITIDTQDQYFIDGRELVDNRIETLRTALQKIVRGRKDIPVIIRSDADASVQAMVTAMDATAQLGLTRLSLATAETSTE